MVFADSTFLSNLVLHNLPQLQKLVFVVLNIVNLTTSSCSNPKIKTGKRSNLHFGGTFIRDFDVCHLYRVS
jgi:hypothetical protein